MPTDTKIDQIVINKLTTEKYEELLSLDQVVNTELYFITDGFEVTEDMYNSLQTQIVGNSTAINSLTTKHNNEISKLTTKVNTEITDRGNADAALQQSIDAIEEDINAIEKDIDDLIAEDGALKTSHAAITVSLAGDVNSTADAKINSASNKIEISTELKNINGLTAGSYGPSADATPTSGAQFDVPSIEIDAKGRIIKASTKKVTMPSVKTIEDNIASLDARINPLEAGKLSNTNPEVTTQTIEPSTNKKLTLNAVSEVTASGWTVADTKTNYELDLSSFATNEELTAEIISLSNAMVFRGTLGLGGTITDLPTAAASTWGDTYKVITAGTYAEKEAKIGDIFTCARPVNEDYSWKLIPSGDEPSGTVINVNTDYGITTADGNSIVSSGTIIADLTNYTKLSNAAADGTETVNRVYPVRLDKNGKLAVNVPWVNTDSNTDNTKVTAGDGLTGGGSADSNTGVTLNVGAGTGISVSADAVSAKLRSTTALTNDSVAATEIANRVYPIAVDKSGYLAVNVPWVDTDITYTAGTGLSLSGTQFNHSNAITAGTAQGGSGALTNGGTFTVPKITYDAQGHITEATTTTYTLPTASDTATNATNIYSTASTSKAYVLGTTTTGSSNKATVYNASVYTSGSVLYGAAWNDYAEYRISDCQEAGRVICENGDDTLSMSIKRLQPGANIVSDTFGFAIGETEEAKTPIAVSGRVLAFPYEDRCEFAAGDAVCAGPNGTVSKMTREEIREYPERIIGTVSAIPNYETWGEGNVPVNGRIWIKVK